jgi:uncharacterized protein YbjT (DUF2867 family)
MSTPSLTVLVVGATGSIGRHVVDAALEHGHQVRALIRDASQADSFPAGVATILGELTDAATLPDAVAGVDAVVFTHGSYRHPEAVNYGAVRNVLTALQGRTVRVALMSAIGVTVRSDGHDWKRRGERLLRASGNPYTIVRPGWFDYNDDDQQHIRMLQGDTRRAGSPADGAIARAQIARVLIDALTTPAAERRTLELVAETGPAQDDLTPLFEALQPDPSGTVDGVYDPANMPAEQEPMAVRDDLRETLPS